MINQLIIVSICFHCTIVLPLQLLLTIIFQSTQSSSFDSHVFGISNISNISIDHHHIPPYFILPGKVLHFLILPGKVLLLPHVASGAIASPWHSLHSRLGTNEFRQGSQISTDHRSAGSKTTKKRWRASDRAQYHMPRQGQALAKPWQERWKHWSLCETQSFTWISGTFWNCRFKISSNLEKSEESKFLHDWNSREIHIHRLSMWPSGSRNTETPTADVWDCHV